MESRWARHRHQAAAGEEEEDQVEEVVVVEADRGMDVEGDISIRHTTISPSTNIFPTRCIPHTSTPTTPPTASLRCHTFH